MGVLQTHLRPNGRELAADREVKQCTTDTWLQQSGTAALQTTNYNRFS